MGGGLGSHRAPLHKRVKNEYVELFTNINNMHYVCNLGMESLISYTRVIIEMRGPKYSISGQAGQSVICVETYLI